MANLNNLKKGQTITEHIDTINENVNLVNDELIEVKNQVEKGVLDVNGKKGNVVLNAVDVGAFPNSTTIQELDINNIKETGVYIGTQANKSYYLLVIKYNNTNVYQELIGGSTKKYRRFTGTWSEWINAYSSENPITASDITGINVFDENKEIEVALLNEGTFVKANLTLNPSTQELKLGENIIATQEYVDNAVNMIKSIIVNELPETGVENTIYFVPNSDEEDNNEFIEWLWVNNTWEIIGGTSIDLTPFLTKEDASNTYATKLENDSKVSKTTTINNKPLSSNITLTAEDVGALPSDIEIETNAVNKYNNEEILTKLSNGEFVNGDTFVVLDDGDYPIGHIYTYNNSLVDITNFVDIATDQSIGGVKNFTGLLKYLGEEVAIKSDIPTSLSELVEDSTHRVVTDTEKTTWNNKSDFSGEYDDLEGKPTIPSIEGLATTEELEAVEAKIPTDYITNQQLTDGLATKQDTLTTTQLEAVNSGANSTNIAQITTNSNDITDLQNNKASIDFVNSSIATNTATFRGTYNSPDELPRTGVDNNDYAFVISTDTSGNTIYNRYKYDGSIWEFEYALNNSSFTAKQWASIQSGITSALVAQITTNKNDIANKADTSALASYLPLSGGTMTGKLSWKGVGALPQDTNPRHFLSIDAFSEGGATKYVDINDLKTALDIPDASSFIEQGGTLTAPLTVTGGDQATAGKIILDETNKGQITNTSTQTLFGYMDATQLAVGHSNYYLRLRGNEARPKYQNQDMALVSDIPNTSSFVTKDDIPVEFINEEYNKTLNLARFIDGSYEISKIQSSGIVSLGFEEGAFEKTPLVAGTYNLSFKVQGNKTLYFDEIRLYDAKYSSYTLLYTKNFTSLQSVQNSVYQCKITIDEPITFNEIWFLGDSSGYAKDFILSEFMINTGDVALPYQKYAGEIIHENAIIDVVYKTDLLTMIYPIGSIYMSVNNVSPASYVGGTWEQLPAGYALWTATSGAGSTISAGLPNITGTATLGCQFDNATGAWYSVKSASNGRNGSNATRHNIAFDASRSSSIYGKSTTVQPPAYKVYAWKRVS